MQRKIKYSSRYFEPFNKLSERVSSYPLFKRIYSEDKGTSVASYWGDDYVNELNPKGIGKQIVESIKRFLDENLFNSDEKKLLLTELKPFIENFGASDFNSIEQRINLIKELGKGEEMSNLLGELQKTITALKEVKENVNVEFDSYYADLSIAQPKIFFSGSDLLVAVEAITALKRSLWKKIMWANPELHRVHTVLTEIVIKFFGKEHELYQEIIAIIGGHNEGDTRAFTEKVLLKLAFLNSESKMPQINGSPFDNLHPKIIGVSKRLYFDGHYADAVSQGFKLVINEIKAKYPGSDGTTLMDRVFSKRNPIHRFSSDDNYQEGMMYLYKGMVMGFRNKYQHENVVIKDPVYAFELLAYSSLLLRLVENPSLY